MLAEEPELRRTRRTVERGGSVESPKRKIRCIAVFIFVGGGEAGLRLGPGYGWTRLGCDAGTGSAILAQVLLSSWTGRVVTTF